ncbi:GntR family transcriptional regulator [Saccharopolyspora sp. MS10]|uniref:GntR family transcriptional regulator n=1 Tax=Saccharopolyspora sp. MS10 TaxID=3385973 RepID=UPI0039A2A87A
MSGADHEKIAEVLRDEIRAQVWKVGERLPSEPELISRFGASRSEVRQAIATLRDSGLAQLRHGIGALVAPPRVVHRLEARERLSRDRRDRNEAAFLGEAVAQGFAATSSVRVWFEPAQEFAGTFGIEEIDEVCVRDRIMFADDHPVMLAVSRLPRQLTAHTALERQDTGPGGVHARLAELGHPVTEHQEVVTAAMPEEHERRALGLSGGPLLLVRRTSWSGDRVVELNDMKLPGHSGELRYRWGAE